MLLSVKGTFSLNFSPFLIFFFLSPLSFLFFFLILFYRLCLKVRCEEERRKSLHQKTVLHNVLGESEKRNSVVLILLRHQRDRQEGSHGAEEDTDHPDHGWEEQAGECLSNLPPYLMTDLPTDTHDHLTPFPLHLLFRCQNCKFDRLYLNLKDSSSSSGDKTVHPPPVWRLQSSFRPTPALHLALESSAAVTMCMGSEQTYLPDGTGTVTFLCQCGRIYRHDSPATLQFRPEKLMRQQERWAAAVASWRGSEPRGARSTAGCLWPPHTVGLVPWPGRPAGPLSLWPPCVCSCLVVIRSSHRTAAPSHLLGGSAAHIAPFSALATPVPELEFTLSACVKFKLLKSETLSKTVWACLKPF